MAFAQTRGDAMADLLCRVPHCVSKAYPGALAAVSVQFIITVLVSLTPPFALEWWRWTKSPPKEFPFTPSRSLIIAGFIGILISVLVQHSVGAFAAGARAFGENPTALFGFLIGLFALIPAFWLGLTLIFKLKRAK